MARLGGALFIFGLGSIILNLLGREFIIMMWVDLWGVGVGWLIRLGMIIGGGLLWFIAQAYEE